MTQKMLRHAEDVRSLSSRREQTKGATIRSIQKNTSPGRSVAWWYPLGWIAAGALAYHMLGALLQAIQPAIGWMDSGIFSLPLFAAWSCLLGYGVAGLLPALWFRIGKKGGIGKWQSIWQPVAMLLAYAGYIAVLCTLL